MLSRRAFLKTLGLALASATLAGCEPQGATVTPTPTATPTPAPTLTLTASPTATPIPTPTPNLAPRVRLYQAWLDLDKLADTAHRDWQEGEAMLKQLGSGHRAALDELAGAGEITAAVGADVQAAFEDVAWHVWRSNALITCYLSTTVSYKPESSEDLRVQAELLTELAGQGTLQADTLARVQAAVERDVAYLALSEADERALVDPLTEARRAGTPEPLYRQLALSISPDVAEAARFLVELLAQEKK
jgi:hypothetical protein